jgi:ribokinase
VIIVFGSINADLIFSLAELPRAGQTLLAREMRIEPGGKGANQAVAAARDGATVCMAGAVGEDGLGRTAMAGLVDAGVDLSRVAVTAAATGCASICTDSHGRNQIIVAPGANALASASLVEDAVLTPQTILLLQLESDHQQVSALIRRAHARGARVILNLAPAAQLDPAVLRLLHLLVVNEDEAAALGGWIGADSDAPALRAALGIGVVRTLGAAGAEAATADGLLRQPAHLVTAVDSTAAGDCFVGVLASALDRGASLASAMHRSGVAAALSCTKAGSQGSIPYRSATDAAI